MKVGVIGAGTMGAGICEVFAKAGWTVAMTASSAASAEKHKAKLAKSYDKKVSKGKITQEDADAILGRIIPGAKEDTCKDADLIVEASKEDMGMKKAVFTELMDIVPKECMFATNTSSLSITEIAAGLDRPVIGMHFFNPAPTMKLVEVIAAEQTPQEMVDKIVEISKELKKVPVVVKEAPGFVVNRILVPLINEGAFVLSEGLASAEDIDTAMKLGAGHPMGPLQLADLVGIDIALAVCDVLYTEFQESKYRACPLLRKKVRAGKLGMKTGEGFFKY